MASSISLPPVGKVTIRAPVPTKSGKNGGHGGDLTNDRESCWTLVLTWLQPSSLQCMDRLSRSYYHMGVSTKLRVWRGYVHALWFDATPLQPLLPVSWSRLYGTLYNQSYGWHTIGHRECVDPTNTKSSRHRATASANTITRWCVDRLAPTWLRQSYELRDGYELAMIHSALLMMKRSNEHARDEPRFQGLSQQLFPGWRIIRLDEWFWQYEQRVMFAIIDDTVTVGPTGVPTPILPVPPSPVVSSSSTTTTNATMTTDGTPAGMTLSPSRGLPMIYLASGGKHGEALLTTMLGDDDGDGGLLGGGARVPKLRTLRHSQLTSINVRSLNHDLLKTWYESDVQEVKYRSSQPPPAAGKPIPLSPLLAQQQKAIRLEMMKDHPRAYDEWTNQQWEAHLYGGESVHDEHALMRGSEIRKPTVPFIRSRFPWHKFAQVGDRWQRTTKPAQHTHEVDLTKRVLSYMHALYGMGALGRMPPADTFASIAPPSSSSSSSSSRASTAAASSSSSATVISPIMLNLVRFLYEWGHHHQDRRTTLLTTSISSLAALEAAASASAQQSKAPSSRLMDDDDNDYHHNNNTGNMGGGVGPIWRSLLLKEYRAQQEKIASEAKAAAAAAVAPKSTTTSVPVPASSLPIPVKRSVSPRATARPLQPLQPSNGTLPPMVITDDDDLIGNNHSPVSPLSPTALTNVTNHSPPPDQLAADRLPVRRFGGGRNAPPSWSCDPLWRCDDLGPPRYVPYPLYGLSPAHVDLPTMTAMTRATLHPADRHRLPSSTSSSSSSSAAAAETKTTSGSGITMMHGLHTLITSCRAPLICVVGYYYDDISTSGTIGSVNQQLSRWCFTLYDDHFSFDVWPLAKRSKFGIALS